ncbi:hypothetical protein [Streptomonospora litoralis]|uniref:Uncharacterized protein n=1 Tax=Streptomonospora litoralis TaxID=2498135 RepID=A0A4P6Q2L1_9ACTN|nr:hypothetical protein [Streptomonospora litoralis]QBI53109.1 hypothetical protein EKD16_06555 [Streptomonospora litoralis]
MNARPRNPHAEVAEIWPRDGAVRVVGDLHGLAETASGRWYLVVALRDSAVRMQYGMTVNGDRFDASVPAEDFVPADFSLQAEGAAWDLFASPEERLESTDTDDWLRLGRHLDDVRDKKKIMVFPVQEVESDGAYMSVRPFYTVNDNLSVGARPGSSAPFGKESP